MKKLKEIQHHIEQLAHDCHRDPKSILLMVASKYFTPDQILMFYREGIRDFGENRIQDFLAKKNELPKDIRWHFLGHIQRNKINKVKDVFSLIQSIDSMQIAEKLSEASSKTQSILIQIKTTQDPSKTGFSVEEFKMVYPALSKLEKVKIRGLMTLGPKEGDPRSSFQVLKQLKDEYKQPDWILSMGMSQDYPIAIEEGANLVRIGRALL